MIGRQYGMSQFLEYPVKNRKDWEKIKERFNPTDPQKYPLNCFLENVL